MSAGGVSAQQLAEIEARLAAIGAPYSGEVGGQELRDIAVLVEAVKALRAVLREVTTAYDVCDSNRGAFSCHDAHDLRCPKDRAASAAEWTGEWVCECGREDLDAALGRAAAVRGTPQEGL